MIQTTFEAHILHQFKRACEAIDGKFTFFTFQDQSMTECVKRVLRDTLQLKQVRCDSNETMKLFERDFILPIYKRWVELQITYFKKESFIYVHSAARWPCSKRLFLKFV